MIALLLGGIGLFLLGMWMMTEGLKLAAGNALGAILGSATSSPLRGLLAGTVITAVVQSSTAVTVATIGFVNAGLLNLAQSMWVVFGASVGNTTTGWLVAAIGIKLDMAVLALPLLGCGMVLRLLSGGRPRLAGAGQALAGFGAFFLGIGFLQEGFAGWADDPPWVAPDIPRPLAILLFVVAGVVLTQLTQSSSATIAIVLTAAAGGSVPLELAAAVVVGASVGTTTTAAFAAIGATPPAKRVAAAHIIFNLLAAAATLAALPWLLRFSAWVVRLAGGETGTPLTLAVFHTAFNCLAILLVWPLHGRLRRWLDSRFVSADEAAGRPRYLDDNLAGVPDLALRSLVAEAGRMAAMAFAMARGRIGGEAANGAGGGTQQGLMALGRAIRGYIGAMNRQALPDSVAAAIPDVIRGVQHLEDIAATSSRIAMPDTGTLPAEAASLIDRLRLEALDDLASIENIPEGEEDDDSESAEALYQRLKAELLREAAVARMPVAAMEAVLLQARLLRRCAALGRKARRRLGHLLVAYGPDPHAIAGGETDKAA